MEGDDALKNIFFKVDGNTRKMIFEKYEFMGARFYMAIIPQKPKFFEKCRIKKRLKSLKGAYAYNAPDWIDFLKNDNRICLCENIYDLCRKIIKSDNYDLPKIGISDKNFTEDSVSIIKNLGRLSAQIYIFTTSKTAYSYVDYMLTEFGCTICIKTEEEPVDILISIDTDGKINVNIQGKYINNIRLLSEIDGIAAPNGIISDRLYDFLRLSGMRQTKKIKISEYKLK